MSMIGACVYRWGGDIAERIRLLQPHFVVIGSGAWTDLDAIAGACAPTLPLIILRDMREDLIDQDPHDVIDRMAAVARQHPGKRFVFHLLNENHSPYTDKARDWELAAIKYAHQLDSS